MAERVPLPRPRPPTPDAQDAFLGMMMNEPGARSPWGPGVLEGQIDRSLGTELGFGSNVVPNWRGFMPFIQGDFPKRPEIVPRMPIYRGPTIPKSPNPYPGIKLGPGEVLSGLPFDYGAV